MRRARSQPIRNKLDLSDSVQVRLVRKRLRISNSQLAQIVGKIGNSISAISKEAALKRDIRLPAKPAAEILPGAVIAATASVDQTAIEIATTEQGP